MIKPYRYQLPLIHLYITSYTMRFINFLWKIFLLVYFKFSNCAQCCVIVSREGKIAKTELSKTRNTVLSKGVVLNTLLHII